LLPLASNLHVTRPLVQRLRGVLLVGIPGAFLFLAASAAAQEPPQPPPPQESTPPASPTPKSPSKHSHAEDFLITGTVFTDQGYAFPGIQIRIRRTDEKKFRWESYANSRGEFAVRVPKGTDYEMLVHAKGFLDQSKPVDAKSGLSEARLVFRMEAEKENKK
jgi:hypothetical protein